jgi:ABC-type amino acid transport substrate-binding protein
MVKLVASLTAVAALAVGMSDRTAAQTANEPVFERIQKSGTVHCGYSPYPPFIIKDKAGNLSGIFYELTERLGPLTGWKFEWTTQVGYPTEANPAAIKDMVSGKFDMLCGGIQWQVPWEQKQMWATPTPLFFTGMGVYVRADDKRFPDGFRVPKLNDPQYTMVAHMPSISDRIHKAEFPNAKAFYTGYGGPDHVPGLASVVFQPGKSMLQDLVDGKGDFTVAELELGNQYMSLKPGKLRNITVNNPMRAMPVQYQVPYGEVRLRQVIDSAVRELLWGGTVDYLLDKYEEYPNTFYRVAMPYRLFDPAKK